MKVAQNKFLLSLISALLFFLAWNPIGLVPLIFIALIPLFQLHHLLREGKRRVYISWMYLALLMFNVATTWWVWNSTPWGAVTMLVLNSLLMTLPFLLFRWLHRKRGLHAGQIGFGVFWVTFEYIHHQWDVSWPWLSFGNAFSDFTNFVQWYEFTGIFGGSILVLLVNILIWNGITQKKRSFFYGTAALLIALGAISFALKNPNRIQETDTIEAVCIQPNYDAYIEKFTLPPSQMLNEMIQLSETEVGENTDILLWPETALVENVDVRFPAQNFQLNRLRLWKKRFPKLSIYTGADAQKEYFNTPFKPEKAARQFKQARPNMWWVFYNASYMLSGDSISEYMKSKLVPGTEIMPFADAFPFINDLAVVLDENSASGSLGTRESYEPLKTFKHSIVPAICYESIYGEHIAKFVRNGADYIAVITNDAWWGNTPGYKQHLSYAKLRAIENRKWVARSANTGISAFINPQGEIVKSSKWEERIALKQNISTNQFITFYTRHGDYLGRAAVLGTFIMLILGFIPRRFF